MEDVYDLVVIGAGRPEFSEVCLPGSASSHSSLIHSTAWKGNSRKFGCTIVHRPPIRAERMASEGLHAA